jgi:hypothetical protein
MAGMAPELLHRPGCEGVSPEKSCFPVRAVSAGGLVCRAHTAILSLSRRTDPRIRTDGKIAQARPPAGAGGSAESLKRHIRVSV